MLNKKLSFPPFSMIKLGILCRVEGLANHARVSIICYTGNKREIKIIWCYMIYIAIQIESLSFGISEL